jgi:hypothetical protein
VSAPEQVPMPGDCHPAYADDKQLLRAWLTDGKRDVLRLPVPERFRVTEDPSSLTIRVRTFTKREAAAPAPYVGRPFRYRWWVGTDDLGRSVASDAGRWYRPGDNRDQYGRPWPDMTAPPHAFEPG